jgi:hypothetical protein
MTFMEEKCSHQTAQFLERHVADTARGKPEQTAASAEIALAAP